MHTNYSKFSQGLIFQNIMCWAFQEIYLFSSKRTVFIQSSFSARLFSPPSAEFTFQPFVIKLGLSCWPHSITVLYIICVSKQISQIPFFLRFPNDSQSFSVFPLFLSSLFFLFSFTLISEQPVSLCTLLFNSDLLVPPLPNLKENVTCE